MTVKQLAAALNMTTRTLNRKMKTLIQKVRKTSLRGFVLKLHLCFLKAGKTISQIANICGYSDETAFRRAFSAMMGMSPEVSESGFDNEPFKFWLRMSGYCWLIKGVTELMIG